MEDLDLPEIKRKKLQEKKAEDKKEFKDLFQSDSESGDDDDDAGLKIKSEMTHTYNCHPHLCLSGRDVLLILASRGLCSVTATVRHRLILFLSLGLKHSPSQRCAVGKQMILKANVISHHRRVC